MYVGITNCKVSMSLNSNTLAVVNEVKDLGVFVDSHLTFHHHIEKIVVRAKLILNCFVSRDVSTVMRALSELYKCGTSRTKTFW